MMAVFAAPTHLPTRAAQTAFEQSGAPAHDRHAATSGRPVAVGRHAILHRPDSSRRDRGDGQIAQAFSS
eukprot:4839104-Pleurochrysis_carterae.AAC.2